MWKRPAIQIGLWVRPERRRRRTMRPAARAILAVAGAVAIASAAGVTAQVVSPSPRQAAPDAPRAAPGEARRVESEPGDFSGLHRITSSGVYRLSCDLFGAANRHGVVVAANEVTLDLGGRTLRGEADSLAGVYVQPGRRGVTIEHGTIVGWGAGGVRADGVIDVRLENVALLHNGGAGVSTGGRATVRSVRAISNGAQGVTVGRWSVIENVATHYNARCGIVAGMGSHVLNVDSGFNGGNGLTLGAMSVAIDSTFHRNAEKGAFADKGSRLESCAATANAAGGFRLRGDSVAVRCSATENGGQAYVLEPGAAVGEPEP
jgi:hypothetical protein